MPIPSLYRMFIVFIETPPTFEERAQLARSMSSIEAQIDKITEADDEVTISYVGTNVDAMAGVALRAAPGAFIEAEDAYTHAHVGTWS